MLNNPNNPTGKLYTQEELMGIAEIVRDFNLIVIADEVYEWHVWDKKMIRFGEFLVFVYIRSSVFSSLMHTFLRRGVFARVYKVSHISQFLFSPISLLQPVSCAFPRVCAFSIRILFVALVTVLYYLWIKPNL